jgi:hypothetical protein
MSQNLIVDTEAFKSYYPESPFEIGHNLTNHPLFEVPRLLELLKVLPDHKISYFTGKVGVNEDKKKAPPTGLTAEETIRQIQDCESWLVLKNVELDAEYRRLVEDCLNEVAPMARTVSEGVRQFEGWIFLTSPQSLTPYHLDPEHNFLLQIRGEKILHVFDPADREILSEEELENYYAQFTTVGKLEFDDKYQDKVLTYTLRPGNGVFLPVCAPHWLKVKDDISISFSITFYTEDVYRRARLYRFNSKLRSLGLRPSPYGKSSWRDATKNALVSTIMKTNKLLGRGGKSNRAY